MKKRNCRCKKEMVKTMKYITLFLVIFSLKAVGQTLPDFTVPASYKKVLETKGDLDKDGIEEVIIVYDETKKLEDNGFKRHLYILKTINGKLKTWKTNSTILWDSKDCGFCADAGINLSVKIKNYTLTTEQTFWHSTRHTSIFRNIFRYQHSDWYLIGSTYNDRYNCGYNHTYDINFSTKQVHITYADEDCDGNEQQPAVHKNFKYPFKSVPKMDGFSTGKGEIKIPGSDKYFYY